MALNKEAINVLEETSRTFFIPIMRLPQGLQDAVGSAYLCMRGIDEIEDHTNLQAADKIKLLASISRIFQSANESVDASALDTLFAPHLDALPNVTRKLSEFASHAPKDVAHRVWDATAAMADRMARWVECGWQIDTESDLDAYTYSVAGAIGVLLSDLWSWHDGTRASRVNAVAFGRGLQAVNIARNRKEDLERGADFFPNAWSADDMTRYINAQLCMADEYVKELPDGPAADFCAIPLSLARGTVDALTDGRGKLSRREVIGLVEKCTGEPLNLSLANLQAAQSLAR